MDRLIGWVGLDTCLESPISNHLIKKIYKKKKKKKKILFYFYISKNNNKIKRQKSKIHARYYISYLDSPPKSNLQKHKISL